MTHSEGLTGLCPFILHTGSRGLLSLPVLARSRCDPSGCGTERVSAERRRVTDERSAHRRCFYRSGEGIWLTRGLQVRLFGNLEPGILICVRQQFSGLESEKKANSSGKPWFVLEKPANKHESNRNILQNSRYNCGKWWVYGETTPREVLEKWFLHQYPKLNR